MKLQNTITANRLNTAMKMKNTAPRPGMPLSNAHQNPPRHAMNTRYTTGRKTRRGNLATSPPYTGCSTSMAMKVPVNSTCSV